jgi:hypothetical protein
LSANIFYEMLGVTFFQQMLQHFSKKKVEATFFIKKSNRHFSLKIEPTFFQYFLENKTPTFFLPLLPPGKPLLLLPRVGGAGATAGCGGGCGRPAETGRAQGPPAMAAGRECD